MISLAGVFILSILIIINYFFPFYIDVLLFFKFDYFCPFLCRTGCPNQN